MKKKVMLKEKLLRVSIVLIALFTATIYFVTDNKVSNLIDKNISAELNSISGLGLSIMESKYGNDWNTKDGKLYIAHTGLNNNHELIDEIKEKTGSLVSLYLGKERVATGILDKDGERTIGYMVSDEVAEIVLKKGVGVEVSENILGKKHSVKYVPIKDSKGKIIGMWSVAIPKSFAESQIGNMFAMRASIVVISVICGLFGCFLLLLYTKKFLKGIDTLKVAFLESGSNNSKTQKKVLLMSLLLIGTFFLIWFIIQGFTIGNVVSKIENNNVKNRLNSSTELTNMLFDEKYRGSWSVEGDKLYKGVYNVTYNSSMMEKISNSTQFTSSIFLGDTIVATSLKKEEGVTPVGTKAPNKVVETVLQQGKEFTGETTLLGKRIIAKFVPLKDVSGKTVGMLNTSVEKKITASHITNIRKAITQISLLAIIIAFSAFLYLSIEMVSDIKNFDVSLHTNIN